ncbi:hypothetical protein PTKIN_Ptkin10aG0002700 [Pterospermum kingtungense]
MSSPNDSQVSKRTNRKWNYEEDVALVSCMVDLRNIGSYNADTGFKADSEKNMVTAEDSVWQSYLISHKDTAPFRTKRFHFFNELCEIYGKDRATGKDAQSATDIVEEIQNKDNDNSPDVGSADEWNTQQLGDDMEMSFAPSMSSSSKKRKAHEMSDTNTAEVLVRATTLLTDKMVEIGEKLSESVGTEMRLEKRAKELAAALDEIEGLTEDERDNALSKILEHPTQIVVFFSLLPSRRLRWVHKFLSTH